MTGDHVGKVVGLREPAGRTTRALVMRSHQQVSSRRDLIYTCTQKKAEASDSCVKNTLWGGEGKKSVKNPAILQPRPEGSSGGSAEKW